jgi:hypothetical protein
MKGRPIRFVVTISVLATALPALSAQAGQAAAAADQRMEYALNLVKGRSYEATVSSDSNAVQQSQGQVGANDDSPVRSQVSMGITYRLDVNDVDANGNVTALCTVTWVRFTQKAGASTMTYDSSDKSLSIPPDALASGPIGFFGQKFTVRFSRQGQVQDIQGLDAIRENILNRIPRGPAREQVAQGLTDQRLDAFIREYFLRPLAIYPSVPVRVGDSWNRREPSETSPYDTMTSWTLKSRKGGVGVIEANAVLTPKSPTGAGMGLAGRSVGQIEIDEQTGRILHSRMTQTTSGRLMAGSSTLAVKSDNVTTFEMTERHARP